jgi:hypothetical protein
MDIEVTRPALHRERPVTGSPTRPRGKRTFLDRVTGVAGKASVLALERKARVPVVVKEKRLSLESRRGMASVAGLRELSPVDVLVT